MITKSFWVAALIAGGATGLLSSLPIISILNCLLCAWVWIGGGFAVWLYNRREPQNLATGQGAVIGLAMGAVAAIISSVLGALIGGAFIGAMGAIDPQSMPDIAEGLLGAGIGLVINLVIYPIFGLFGGMIGTEIFKSS
jgi:hypothetical protein